MNRRGFLGLIGAAALAPLVGAERIGTPTRKAEIADGRLVQMIKAEKDLVVGDVVRDQRGYAVGWACGNITAGNYGYIQILA